MKTILGTLLALGLLSTSASAWYCPPGYSYGHGYQSSYNRGHSYHRPTYGYGHAPTVIVKPSEGAPTAPAAPIEPPALPAPDAVPPK